MIPEIFQTCNRTSFSQTTIFILQPQSLTDSSLFALYKLKALKQCVCRFINYKWTSFVIHPRLAVYAV